MAQAHFFVGQLVEHNLFGYRGVVIGVDPTFNHTDAWYESVAKSRPPKDQPWYHVLVHESDHMTYVAERNLRVSLDTTQIDHPLLGAYFDRYDGARYFPRHSMH
ncbi:MULTISPECIES: heat shock protein HspQ [unclassified Hahella]|uniref:heat shock protein HspQ n=1 Tax=unclassified Hahella TaxID=2624107 RepID=UPI000FDCEE57|nr:MULTISPECIES: heat shock protein HspQ [unclassified Hahella]AZZ89828.1 heat shock protein HspQ [Hahella sp. KA22]MBU6950371.1 heat shock protein HspQ [Hahella sp. HN01]MDG9666295.1 heat shock protein HspQ [Hahella sp. CR1]QAY53197.1 heat shock protein HspQ [Hahella sp. KA22]WLQ12867.1 heat shock protein HspQ [Hahella sp. HNIBRBA332]